jgi:hypothetical protein
MQTTDLIILMLVVIDVVSLSMVTFIFRWARKAMDNFRYQVMELLSGETEESVAIIEKLGHTIYQKLYRYFNLKVPDADPMNEQNPVQEIAKKYLAQGGQSGSSSLDLSGAAAAMGISDPGFLKYLPAIQKLMAGKTGDQKDNISSSEYW